MKHGVRYDPLAVRATPARAVPSVASRSSWTGCKGGNLPSVPVEQHGVAERQEAVALGEGDGVEVAPAGADERVDHHEQGRAGQVEVGEQHVDDLERGAPM